LLSVLFSSSLLFAFSVSLLLLLWFLLLLSYHTQPFRDFSSISGSLKTSLGLGQHSQTRAQVHLSSLKCSKWRNKPWKLWVFPGSRIEIQTWKTPMVKQQSRKSCRTLPPVRAIFEMAMLHTILPASSILPLVPNSSIVLAAASIPTSTLRRLIAVEWLLLLRKNKPLMSNVNGSAVQVHSLCSIRQHLPIPLLSLPA
jgi:hypothetical protein